MLYGAKPGCRELPSDLRENGSRLKKQSIEPALMASTYRSSLEQEYVTIC
jgi:lambda repressor-like predicted transcriptional regulator